MSDLNLCQFIGRLGKDPEAKYMANGKAVCNFSIAVGESWKDKNSGEKKEKTEWVNIVVYDKLAEIVSEYCKKGSQIYAAGKMQTRKWQDKEGNDRYSTEVVMTQMQMLGGKQKGETKDEPKPTAKSEPAQPEFDDDIPF